MPQTTLAAIFLIRNNFGDGGDLVDLIFQFWGFAVFLISANAILNHQNNLKYDSIPICN